MPNFKKLSIIIVNYRSEVFLRKCLASLFHFDLGIDFEIVVVNNDQQEKLAEIKKEFPSVITIASPKNNGFGAACNLGTKNSQGDLLFFLNPDTEIQSSFNLAIDELEQNPEIGILGPRLLGEKGKVQKWSAGAKISFWDLIRNNLGFPRSRKIWESLKTEEAAWVSGAALFTPRQVFSEAGGFDENFFMYFEDNDFCQRVRRAGKRVIYFPAVSIKHREGESFKDEKKKKEYYYQSQEYYFRKHCGSWSVFWLKFLKKIF